MMTCIQQIFLPETHYQILSIFDLAMNNAQLPYDLQLRNTSQTCQQQRSKKQTKHTHTHTLREHHLCNRQSKCFSLFKLRASALMEAT